jgi:hypothetical protein
LELLFVPLITIVGTNVLDKVEEIILISVIALLSIISVVFLGIHMLKDDEAKIAEIKVTEEVIKDTESTSK